MQSRIGRVKLPSRVLVRRVLIGLLLVELVYVAVVNLFLASALGHSVVNLREERLRIDYDRAFSPWPGKLWVRGLRLRGQSPRMQWQAEGNRASGRISLLPLLMRSFRVSGLRADGVTFLLRRRQDAAEDGAAAPELQPPIPGLENPPTRKPELLYRTRPPESSWTVTLAGCRLTGVEELWFEQYRLVGDMAVRGGMRLRLKRTTTIRRSSMTLEGVELRVGERVVASGLAGEVRVSSKEFHHREHRGVSALGFFSGVLDIAGRLESLGFLNFYLREAPWLRFVEGSGELDAEVRLKKGRFVPGSRFALQPARFAAAVLDDRAEGDGTVNWGVSEEDPPQWELLGELESFTIRRQGHEAPHVHGEGLRFEARGERLLVPEAFRSVDVVVDLPTARVPDLTFYNAYLPEGAGLSVVHGSGSISGRLEASTSSGQGRAWVELLSPGLEVDFEGVALRGELAVHGDLPDIDLRGKTFSLDGTEVSFEHASLVGEEEEDEAGEEWWARAVVDRGVLTPGRPVAVAADFRAELLDSRPALALISARRDLPGWVERIVKVRDLSASGTARLGKGLLEIDDLQVDGDKLEVRARVRRRAPGRHDLVFVRYGILRLGVELQGEDSRVKVVRPLRWYEGRLQELVEEPAADEPPESGSAPGVSVE